MKTIGIETFLIVMIISALCWTLFIYLGNGILKFLKTTDPPKLRQSGREFNAAALATKTRRRKIETNVNVICSLPIHQESRREAPLS